MNIDIQRGASRIVVLIAASALKFPTVHSWRQFLRGLMANMDEAEFYRRGAIGLCPVTFAVPGGFLTIMKRAAPLSDVEWGIIAYRPPDVFAAEVRVEVEHKRSSWGTIGGEIVAVDYAGPI
jgi:hypothetical protein